MLSALVFAIGAIIQTVNTHSLTAFYIARVIAGLGLGSATVVVPMFNSEMMPKELRGQVGSFFQWFYTFVRRNPLIVFPGTCADGGNRVSSYRTLSITASQRASRRTSHRNGRSQLACNSCPPLF